MSRMVSNLFSPLPLLVLRYQSMIWALEGIARMTCFMLCKMGNLELDILIYQLRVVIIVLSNISYLFNKPMQRFAVEIKAPVWAKLKVIFNKYSGNSEHMVISRLEDVIKEVLKEETPSEVDYVIKNMSRIDKDNNGTIEFEEFGNFLLKRHCGEMALQKMHRCNKLKNGHLRKITKEEFGQLLNSAYEFLNLEVDQKVISDIFDNVDKDKDGLVTYAEYFGFTDSYLLDTRPAQERRKLQPEKMEVFGTKTLEPQQPVKEFQSRLRKFLLNQLRRIFEAYDKDVNHLLDQQETRLLLMEFFGLNNSQINNIFRDYFKPDVGGRYQSYEGFVANFLQFAGDQGWFRLTSELVPKGRNNISQSQFFRLIDDAFRHLNIGRVNKTIFLNYFKLLDKNSDGMLEQHDFKEWIIRFLSPQKYIGNEYYVREDDDTQSWGRGMISDLPLRVQYSPARSMDVSVKSMKMSGIRVQTRIQHKHKQKVARPSMKLTDSQISVMSNRSGRDLVCKFNFSSLNLAKRVRKQMMIMLERLDKNHNKQFEESEIVEALQVLMKADKRQVLYVIANVFRYDRNEDNIVTYEELANFFLEIHFGQIAIQRLHKEDSYVRGAERMMNMDQFVRTLDYALSFIEIETYEGEAETLFRQIDLNKDGWITYQQYFQFLIHYFGTESVVAQTERRNRRKTLTEITTTRGQEVPPEQRLSRLIRTQIRVMFIEYDRNKNIKFEKQEALQIAREVLDQTDEEANQMVSIVFKKNPQIIDYDTLINKFLELHTAETIILRLHKEGVIKHYKDKCIDLSDFMTLINSAFVNISILPTKDQYAQVFKRLDPINEKISYRQYQHFVARYIGKSEDRSFNTVFEEPPSKLSHFVKKTISNSPELVRDKGIAGTIFSSLKSVYDNFDRLNQGVERNIFEEFLKSAFGGVKKQNIDHIIWSIYRVDKNQDSKINIFEATPYMLRLQSELVLHDHHRSSNILDNKERLNGEDFIKVLKASFPFCSLQRDTLLHSFQRLDDDNDGYVSDIDFLSWVNSISKLCVL